MRVAVFRVAVAAAIRCAVVQSVMVTTGALECSAAADVSVMAVITPPVRRSQRRCLQSGAAVSVVMVTTGCGVPGTAGIHG